MSKNPTQLIFSILVILFNACSNQSNETVEHSVDNALVYYGESNSKKFTKRKRVYEQAVTKPSLFKITSSGESGIVGMETEH